MKEIIATWSTLKFNFLIGFSSLLRKVSRLLLESNGRINQKSGNNSEDIPLFKSNAEIPSKKKQISSARI